MAKVYTVERKEKNPIIEKFEDIGARAKIRKPKNTINRWRVQTRSAPKFIVDVAEDKNGQYFDILISDDVDLNVVNVRKDIKHLLLMFKEDRDKTKILCGHDEREWFTSQVETKSKDVVDAMELLKPNAVRASQKKAKVKRKNINKRHNNGFIRQGEWFFVPADIEVDGDLVLRNEPLMLSGQRAGNKPHIAKYAYRTGGETVYVPNIGAWKLSDFSSGWRDALARGLTESSKRSFLNHYPDANISFRTMSRNPDLYVTGTVRHPDHKTISLTGWHRVYVNGEIRGQNVVFLD